MQEVPTDLGVEKTVSLKNKSAQQVASSLKDLINKRLLGDKRYIHPLTMSFMIGP